MTNLADSRPQVEDKPVKFVPGQPELRLVRELRHGGTGNVYAAEFTRDGRLLLTSSGDR